MSAQRADDGSFGAGAVYLSVKPDATLDQLLFDVRCLGGQALEVFEVLMDMECTVELPEAFWGGIYLLRQALFVAGHAQEHADAAARARLRAEASEAQGGAA